MKHLVVVLALASCGKNASSLVENKLGSTSMLINLPAGVTVQAETGSTFSFHRGSEVLGMVMDTGLPDWPDASSLQACDLGNPKPFETSNMRGVTCGKDGKFRTLAYVKPNAAGIKNVQSCSYNSSDAGEGEEICMTLSGAREHY